MAYDRSLAKLANGRLLSLIEALAEWLSERVSFGVGAGYIYDMVRLKVIERSRTRVLQTSEHTLRSYDSQLHRTNSTQYVRPKLNDSLWNLWSTRQ